MAHFNRQHPLSDWDYELSKLELPFLLLPGPSVVPLGEAERPHACLHLFLLAERGSQQQASNISAPMILSSPSLSLSALSVLCRRELASILAAPVSHIGAGRGRL